MWGKVGGCRRSQTPLEPVPWRPVAAICGGIFVLLMAVSTRYGWHRDELYFLEAGKHHLAWGYVDQPPFTPFVARLADQIAPGNLAVLRLLPAITAVTTIVLGTLIARELGARRSGQIVALRVHGRGRVRARRGPPPLDRGLRPHRVDGAPVGAPSA